MLISEVVIPCIVTKGHQIASGKNPDSPYPDGSVVLQFPLFKGLGLDLEHFHPATLNLSIAPATFNMKVADYCFENLNWIEGFNPETFSFVSCELVIQGHTYPAWVYYPHPETKTRDFHNNSLIEVLAPFIENVAYGDKVELRLDSEKIAIQKSNPC